MIVDKLLVSFRLKVCAGLAVAVSVLVFGAAPAMAESVWWGLTSSTLPESLPSGGKGLIDVTAENLGDRTAQGTPIVFKDTVPAGLSIQEVSFYTPVAVEDFGFLCSTSGQEVSCEFPAEAIPVNLSDTFELRIEVKDEGAGTGSENEFTISGGESASRSLRHPLQVGSTPASFGVEQYEQKAEEEGGVQDTQAGSHPFQLTTTLLLNQTADASHPPAMPKDLKFNLPPGLIGNPTPLPQCTDVQFATLVVGAANLCPVSTAVGVAAVTIDEPATLKLVTIPVPVFNLVPATGEPARFGFEVLGVPVILDTSVRTGGDYGVTVSVSNITESAAFVASRVTFWGVPGDPRHDGARGWPCVDGGRYAPEGSECAPTHQQKPPPFLTLPTSCTGPLHTTVEADSWVDPGVLTQPFAAGLEEGLDGCNRLPFSASLGVAPDGPAASTPSGLTVGIHVPQEEILNPTGLAAADVKDTTVALPVGVSLNPAAADGLMSCSLGQIALDVDTFPSCPEASKVGTVEIKSPLLPNALNGAVYLAAQAANPFGSLVAIYLVAQDPVSGTLIKVAGEVKPDPVTGQLVSTFNDTPQLPFEDLELHFFGGSRAPLGTPAFCGAYTTAGSIVPWSENKTAPLSSTFDITSGPNGSPCTNPLPFDPTLTAGSTNIQTGSFTPFTMTMSREDGQQNLKAVQLHMPAGLLGTLSNVKLCEEARANAGTCGPESEIGETVVSVGLGSSPYGVRGGRVYITGPYQGAPYGLSIVNPAKAGPFDLGQVIVRAKIEVDPITAALTVTTDSSGPYAIPQILDGIPLQIKHVNVTINRPNFTFNPTNCTQTAITGGLTSSEGATDALSVPFQVTNCATLAFKPQFKVSTAGRTSRANGASLDVKLAYPKAPWGSQANIRSVKVDLPKLLPSRLTTLQKACTDSTFNHDPASCPAGSRVGTATATTPIIPVSLAGPAYFVSHGGAKFPELVIVLSGYGVTVQLHGETFISPAGITSSTFRTIPDVPIGMFELKLPQGKDSALAANGNLCTAVLKMPTTFTAQNGLVIKQSTPVTATGCAKHKKAKKKTKKVGIHRTGSTRGKK
jgi:hypothetical protein